VACDRAVAALSLAWSPPTLSPVSVVWVRAFVGRSWRAVAVAADVDSVVAVGSTCPSRCCAV
jgi:hypothetical protein